MATDNPFEVTKAVDFSDDEIASTWVDLPGGGFTTLAPPTSPMPRFLVGGKGGGRTHLLRYYSYPLQKLRHRPDVLGGIRSDGYIGIYFRCTGLNSARFSGKGCPEEVWRSVFAYYTDIWLAQLVVEAVADLVGQSSHDSPTGHSLDFVGRALDLLNLQPPEGLATEGIPGLIRLLRSLQRDLDAAVNNAALTRTLDVTIGANPGRLTFGVPAAAIHAFPELSTVKVAYLIDEFENLTAPQQMYVNTLVREKELPSTFLIGSRLWGVKTHHTYSADEENKQGSEFDQVVLETTYRERAHNYDAFCAGIVRTRLQRFQHSDAPLRLDDQFESPTGASLEERAKSATWNHLPRERPWLVTLARHLDDAGLSESECAEALSHVRIEDDPLGERFALFLFYRRWAKGEDLLSGAVAAGEGAAERHSSKAKQATSYKHYKADLYAQLLDDLDQQQEYFGLDTFIRMSGYLPRNLLIVLKQITRWSQFLGDEPFRGGRLSLRAQTQGVRDASAWFLADATGLGRLGADAQTAVRRLGEYLGAQRFSCKPVEPECAAIEVARRTMTSDSLKCLDEAVSHSLLLEIPSGRRDRNTKAFHHKYQLNPMLAPLFNLPLTLRGTASLSTVEATTIFSFSTSDTEFAALRDRRRGQLNPPFHRISDNTTDEQGILSV